MKIRTGFVSNSSSSSFVIICSEKDFAKLETILDIVDKEINKKRMVSMNMSMLANYMMDKSPSYMRDNW